MDELFVSVPRCDGKTAHFQEELKKYIEQKMDDAIELDKPYFIDDYRISFVYTKDSTTATHFIISRWAKNTASPTTPQKGDFSHDKTSDE